MEVEVRGEDAQTVLLVSSAGLVGAEVPLRSSHGNKRVIYPPPAEKKKNGNA